MAGLDDFVRVFDEFIRQRGNVDEAVLVHADVDEGAKGGDVGHDAFEDHVGLQVGERLDAFLEGVEKLDDLHPGMKLEGVVTNVTAFGAFVDVGVHQDGLVHVSQLADRFVKNPADVVKVGDKLKVHVLEVDLARRRISLSARTQRT